MLQPITQEYLDMASRAIGFRSEAETLRSKNFYFDKYFGISLSLLIAISFVFSDSFRISQEHAKQLEEKLNASEVARKIAEAKVRDAEGLQAKLDAAEKHSRRPETKRRPCKIELIRLTPARPI